MGWYYAIKSHDIFQILACWVVSRFTKYNYCIYIKRTSVCYQLESSYILGKMLRLSNNLAFHLAFHAIKRGVLHILDNQFALAFLAGHRYFSLHFQPLSAFHGKRKKEFGRKHSQRKPLTTTTTYVRHSVKLIALLALQHTFHLFRKKMHLKILKKTYEL